MVGRCQNVWADSVMSKNEDRKMFSGFALETIGGRAAVDALRSAYEKTGDHVAGISAVHAMATTGSPEDVKFLIAQLGRTGDLESWTFIQGAALTLGFLREQSARSALELVARRYGDRMAGSYARIALARLDRPPCGDSTSTDFPRLLVRLAMQCTPNFLGEKGRWRDESTGEIWTHDGTTWMPLKATVGDSVKTKISARVDVFPDQQEALGHLGTWCGDLCGSGWTYRVKKIGRAWQVIGAQFDWIS
jgi:hypothetical protein